MTRDGVMSEDIAQDFRAGNLDYRLIVAGVLLGLHRKRFLVTAA
jgi:hypothetical protein